MNAKPRAVVADAAQEAALRKSGKWKEGVPLFRVVDGRTLIDADQIRELGWEAKP